jgi:protein O-GlcNAc transferase
MTTFSDSRIEHEFQKGLELYKQGKAGKAEVVFAAIANRNPGNLDAVHLLGVIALETGRAGRAVDLFKRIIAVNGGVRAFHNNLGRAYQDLNQFEEAVRSFDRAIELDPNYANAYFNRGIALRALGRLEDAIKSYDKALHLNARDAEAHNNKGIVLEEQNRLNEALESYNNAIFQNRDLVEAYANRGSVLRKLGKPDEALKSYDLAIRVKPGNAAAHYDKGNFLATLNRCGEALQNYDRAIQLDPNHVATHVSRGNALQTLGRLDEALLQYNRAIEIDHSCAEAYSNRGVVLFELGRLDEALKSYDRAIGIRPDYGEAHSNRGNALASLRRMEAAIESYDRAIRLKPDYPEPHANRGAALFELRRFEEALASYNRAIRLKPDFDFLMGGFLHASMTICDWSNYGSKLADFCARILRGEKVTTPFYALSLPISPSLHKKASEIWVESRYPKRGMLGEIAKRPSGQKIRVGYFSADFRDHPVALSMLDLFERHDRSRFELIAFSLGPDTDDEIRRKLSAAFDKFIDVQSMPDRDVAALARELEIDIAIDLNGFTSGARTGIFALRAAPIHVNYLGYPGTMGADYIDYLIADPTLIPASLQPDYAEKIVYLPNSFFPSDRTRKISDGVFERSEFGLPQNGIVFCCFNNHYKITPDVFDSWMRILGHAEGSVLWLREANDLATGNLKKAADVRGIDPERLVFASRKPLPEHLARHRLADLFLDTLPYNAHATASDALWAGLPVLTQIGETFAGRVAASLLNALDLPELIAASRESYEALAIELAGNPAKLASLKRKLARNRLEAPLFDTELFTRHIENAYTMMYERYQARLPPDHINVPR